MPRAKTAKTGKTLKPKKKKQVWQNHHIIYMHPDHPTQPDEIVRITKGEHMLIGKLSWWVKRPTKGFLRALKFYIWKHEPTAREVEE